MSLVDPMSLATTARNINLAHLFGESIARADALEAEGWLRTRYAQDIPASILRAKRPSPRWAKIPRSFTLTGEDRKSKPRPLTGESFDNAALRACHSREAARAQLILGAVTGHPAPEALELCANVRATGDVIAESGSNEHPFYCCGPCTASVWRLAGLTDTALSDTALSVLLGTLAHFRDGKAWRRYPFYYTTLALTELAHPAAADELRYIRRECERKLKRLDPDDDTGKVRIEILQRVLDR